jgi:uncharacterized protein YqiB (DUF1249 family)
MNNTTTTCNIKPGQIIKGKVYGTFLVVKVEAPKTAGIDSPIVTVRLVNDQGLAEERRPLIRTRTTKAGEDRPRPPTKEPRP